MTNSIALFSPKAEEPLAYPPAAAARKMGIGRTLLYELISSGKLRTVKIGARRLITLKAIQDCLEIHEAAP